MAKYKVGDTVISSPKSPGCAPEGLVCSVVEVVDTAFLHPSEKPLYVVETSEGIPFRHYEDELEAHECEYCQKGKTLNYMNFGETAIKTYILGNILYTEAYDNQYDDEDSTAIKIKVCPVCGIEVHKAPYEEMEEQVDE